MTEIRRRPPLSATLITLNAAAQLPACLDSLFFCDEILVVDSGSTDGTVELAQARGARVMTCAWRGFGPQKQFAVEQAAHDWVLCVDADERISPLLAGHIEQVLDNPDYAAYQFPRANRFLGRYLRHGEGYPDLSLRLFDRRQARWSDDAVHEKVLCSGAVGTLSGDLFHDTAESIDSYLSKQNRYTTLAARQAYEAGKRAHVGQLLLSPLFRFVKFYFVRRGFMDGVPGLTHVLIGCFNSFVKYLKMIEIHRNKQGS